MRRASRVLIPAALLCLLGVAVLVFRGELNLPRVDLASLVPWGTASERSEAPAVSTAAPSELPRSAPAGAPAASGTAAPAKPSQAAANSPGVSEPSRDGLKIEFARIDAEGTSVIGGRAPAGSRVTIHANGEIVAVVTASDDGQWSAILTRPFPPGPLGLSITSDAPRFAGLESPTLTIQVPKGSGRVELAAATPKARPILPPRAPAAESRAVSDFAAMVERARTMSSEGDSPRPEANVVPVPITFVTGEATMTPEGTRAAHLLVEYVRIMKPRTIILSGHADVRGGEEYNLDLSRQRLEAIRSILRENGYTGELSLLAKGKSEPYQGIDRKSASLQEIYQADRRVELRLAE